MWLQAFILFLIGSLSYFSFKCDPAVSETPMRNLSSTSDFSETGRGLSSISDFSETERGLSGNSEFSETSRDLINTFSILNDLFNQDIIQIISCTVMSETPSEDKSYRQFSTCLLKGTRFWQGEEKTILVQFHIDNTEPISLILVWQSLSKFNLLKSFLQSRNKIDKLRVKMDSPEVVSDIVEVVKNMPQASPIQDSLFNVAQLNMDEINIEITPYRGDEFLVHLNLFQEEESIYDIDIITNYSSDNADDFFVLPALSHNN